MSSDSTPPVKASLPAAENPEAKSKAQVAKDVFEIGGKTVIGLAGLCYVLGLVVVTIHLREYGLNSLALSQLHYVMAGVWAMLPILLILFLATYLIYAFSIERDRIAKERTIGKVFSIFSMIAGSIVAFYFSMNFVGGRLGLAFGWRSWVLAPLLGTVALFVIAASGFIFSEGKTYTNLKQLFAGLGLLVGGTILSVCYLVYFTSHTYKEIPWSTGGGRPSKVQLMVVADAKPYAEGAGIPFSTRPNRTETLQLLLATDKEFIVLNTSGQAISLPSEIVRSVVYEK